MDYNSRYSKEEFYWGLKPNHLVKDSVKYLPQRAKVLDLGCGEGKDSFFLSKNNFQVTSVDFSERGIRKLNEFAKKEKLDILTEVSDIKSYLKNCEGYDAIFAINLLQFIDKKSLPNIINQIQLKTGKNGLNVISAFIAETKKQREMRLSNGRYLFEEGELRGFYKGWKILFYEEKLGDWETHGGPRHRHFNVKLIAKK